MGLKDELRRLRKEAPTERPPDPENRARMKAVLDELAAARREGRPPSREAREVSEAFEERRRRGA